NWECSRSTARAEKLQAKGCEPVLHLVMPRGCGMAVSTFYLQEPEAGQLITENPHATFGGVAGLCDVRCRRGRIGQCREEIQVDGGFECGGFLIRSQRVEE